MVEQNQQSLIEELVGYLDGLTEWEQHSILQGVYICKAPELQSRLQPVEEVLNISRSRVLKTTGPKCPTLYSEPKSAIYPLKADNATTISGQPPTIGHRFEISSENVVIQGPMTFLLVPS